MMQIKDIILKRIDELLQLTEEILTKRKPNTPGNEDAYYKALYGTVLLLKQTYGDNSAAERTLLALKDSYIKSSATFRGRYIHESRVNLSAVLENLKSEIGHGLLTSLESRVTGEIYGDMISMSKALFDEGHKEASSILASGALEDSMKKFALQNQLDVYEADLSQVVNSLKAAGHLKGTQAGLIQSFVKLRNKAFHAQFDKIEMPEVLSLISFVQQFLIEHFK
jgi:hypothetical protein